MSERLFFCGLFCLLCCVALGVGGCEASRYYHDYKEKEAAMERGYEQVWDGECRCTLWKPTKDTAND